MTHRILVVDDEPDITALTAYHLARAGYRVSTAASGAEALRSAVEERPDLIVLDLMLPGMSGFDVLRRVRSRADTGETAVILLTARREESDRIKGLSLGADDYVVKPFSPEELVLRVKAVLRRMAPAAAKTGSVLVVGRITIDRGGHAVTVDGRELDLTATEYRLLVTLAENRGQMQSRKKLLETVWGANPEIQTRTVDMHVQRLRGKLGSEAELIETVRGFGYRMRVEPDRNSDE